MEFDLENPLTNSWEFPSFDTVPSLFFIESDHMPSHDYLKTFKAVDFDISFRREAISSILEISCNFNPFLSYLAVNYLDRFLSSHGLPEPRPWVLRLLTISCVSLAAKMMKTEFSVADIQGDEGFIFDTQTIQRMEGIILGALKWRMRSVTPFSFISFFISLFKLKDPPLMKALKARTVEIILKAQNDIKLLVFKPSEIAASALLHASHEFFPLQFAGFRKAISNSSYVNMENMLQCHNAMQDIAVDGYESLFDTLSTTDLPVKVLDQHFFSSESGETNGAMMITSTSITQRQERSIKKRKISGYCNNNQRVQISQIQHCL